MSFEWLAEKTIKYRGYLIRPGSIWKDDEIILIFHISLMSSDEELATKGRELIDGYIEGHTT